MIGIVTNSLSSEAFFFTMGQGSHKVLSVASTACQHELTASPPSHQMWLFWTE